MQTYLSKSLFTYFPSSDKSMVDKHVVETDLPDITMALVFDTGCDGTPYIFEGLNANFIGNTFFENLQTLVKIQ